MGAEQAASLGKFEGHEMHTRSSYSSVNVGPDAAGGRRGAGVGRKLPPTTPDQKKVKKPWRFCWATPSISRCHCFYTGLLYKLLHTHSEACWVITRINRASQQLEIEWVNSEPGARVPGLMPHPVTICAWGPGPTLFPLPRPWFLTYWTQEREQIPDIWDLSWSNEVLLLPCTPKERPLRSEPSHWSETDILVRGDHMQSLPHPKTQTSSSPRPEEGILNRGCAKPSSRWCPVPPLLM